MERLRVPPFRVAPAGPRRQGGGAAVPSLAGTGAAPRLRRLRRATRSPDFGAGRHPADLWRRGGFTSGIIMATVIGAAIVLVAAAVGALFPPARPKGPSS
jgi:hypothetical protein